MKSRTTFTYLFLLVTILNVSCSSDAIEGTDIIEEDGLMDDTNGIDGENGGEEDNGQDDGTIAFEAGLVLDEDRRFVNYVVTETAYNAFLQGEGDLRMVTNKIYEYVKDDYDFIFMLNVEEEQPEGLYFGRHTPVQNHVSGTGSNLYDNTGTYGSEGRLKGIIHMPRTVYVKSGPFLHEIAHYWANHNFLETTVGGHWGYASVGGQLGGFDELVDLGNNMYRGRLNGNNNFGTFANGGNSVPYGNAELYLMGLIPADELQSISFARNAERTGNSGEFSADEIVTYTPQDLIEQHGERVPSYANAQKTFNGLAIVLSVSAISQEIADRLNEDLENFSRAANPDDSWSSINNFWEATQGKGTMNIQVLDENVRL